MESSQRRTIRTLPRLRRAIWLGTLSLLLATSAWAKKLFESGFVIDGEYLGVQGVNSLTELDELFSVQNLVETFPEYVDGVSSVVGFVDLRGIPGAIGFEAGSTTLRLEIPVLGISLSFTGENRDESLEKLEDWLRGDYEDPTGTANQALNALLQGAVVLSPVDPVAGNPYSLQNRMIDADFIKGTAGPFVDSDWKTMPMDGRRNFWSVNANAGFFKAGPQNFDYFGVELQPIYMRRFARVPTLAFSFDLPITITSAQSAQSYMLSLGPAVHWQPKEWWTLSPSFRFGGAGSIDVGGLSTMYSLALTSFMHTEIKGITLGWGIQGGFMQTPDMTLGDVKVNYNLSNYPLKNEVLVQGPLTPAGEAWDWRVYFQDTRVFGSDVFLDNYQEVGFGFLRRTRRQTGAVREMPGILAGYLFGKDYSGLALQVRFNF